MRWFLREALPPALPGRGAGKRSAPSPRHTLPHPGSDAGRRDGRQGSSASSPGTAWRSHQRAWAVPKNQSTEVCRSSRMCAPRVKEGCASRVRGNIDGSDVVRLMEVDFAAHPNIRQRGGTIKNLDFPPILLYFFPPLIGIRGLSLTTHIVRRLYNTPPWTPRILFAPDPINAYLPWQGNASLRRFVSINYCTSIVEGECAEQW